MSNYTIMSSNAASISAAKRRRAGCSSLQTNTVPSESVTTN